MNFKVLFNFIKNYDRIIDKMGSVKMNKVWSKLDKPLLIIMILFFSFGLMMVFSSSSIVSVVGFNKSPYNFLMKQALFMLIGYIAFMIIIYVPTRHYSKIAKGLLILIIIALIGLFPYGKITNSAKSWYYIGPFSLQPSEFAKSILIMFMATFYQNNIKKLDNFKVLLFPLVIAFSIFVLVFLQPDLGTAIIIALISILIYFSLPIKKSYKAKIFLLILSLLGISILSIITVGDKIFTKTQLERFNFKSPCERYTESTGYQVCNGYIAMNSGGLFGVGLGNSTQKYLYLPEAHTDFIFPIVVEELGVIAGVAVVLFYVLLIARILVIAKSSVNLKNSIIAYGVAAYIFCHVAVNLIGILGIGPMTGVPLPFLSYGGSFCLNLFISLGLVQRCQIENRSK